MIKIFVLSIFEWSLKTGITVSTILLYRPPDKSVYWTTIFFIFHPKHMLWVLKRTVSMRHMFKHMFKLLGKNIFTILHS